MSLALPSSNWRHVGRGRCHELRLRQSNTTTKPKVGPIVTIGRLTLRFLKKLLPRNPLKNQRNQTTTPHRSTDSYNPPPPYFERSSVDQPCPLYQQVRFLEYPHPLRPVQVRFPHHQCPKEKGKPQRYPYGHRPVAPLSRAQLVAAPAPHMSPITRRQSQRHTPLPRPRGMVTAPK